MESEQDSSGSAQSESRGQTHRKIWESDPVLKDCLQPHTSNKKALCSKRASSISVHYHTLRKHARSKKHLDLMRDTSSTDSVETRETALQLQKKVTRIELILTGFFVEHNIAYRIVDHLIPLLGHCFQDVDVCKMLRLGRTKLTSMTGVIASSYNKKLCITLQKRKFSILTDESTDVSSIKVICIIVRFFDAEIQRIRCALWDLIDIDRDEDSNETPENLYNNIINSFTVCNIPLENIIGFGSDGCNSMMGSHNSVASRFKNDCPNITIFKCICHTAHLCANYACKTLPRECEDLGRNIYNFFQLNSKWQHQFKEFQILLDAEVQKMLYSAQTRWLSLKAVVDRILEQWEPLQMYFSQLWEEQHLPAAEIIYSSLTHPFVKCYYLFLEWVLPKFTKFNLLFQSDKVIIPLLYNQAAVLFKDILICYMDNRYVLSTNVKDIDPGNELHFLPLNEISLGLKVNTELQKPEIKQQAKHVENFRLNTFNFLKEASKELQKRFDFTDLRLRDLECFIPHKAIDPGFHVTIPTLVSIFQMFPRNLDSSSFTSQSVDNEWRLLAFAQLPLDITNEKVVDVFWVKLLNYEDIMGLQKYKNLSQFVLNLLCLPHSNAECERLFSKVNLTKTKNRNKMKTTILKNNLTAWECVKNSGTCKLFEPSADMIDHCNNSMYNFHTSNKDHENIGVSDEDSE